MLVANKQDTRLLYYFQPFRVSLITQLAVLFSRIFGFRYIIIRNNKEYALLFIETILSGQYIRSIKISHHVVPNSTSFCRARCGLVIVDGFSSLCIREIAVCVSRHLVNTAICMVHISYTGCQYPRDTTCTT